MKTLLGFANSLSREFAQQHLSNETNDVTVFTAGSLAETIELANRHPDIDVITLDLAMNDMDGIRGVRKFREAVVREVPLAVMGSHLPERDVRGLLLSGVAGYLPYTMSASALIGALSLMAAGGTYIPLEFMNYNGTKPSKALLTTREQEVLTGLLSGRSNKEIAGQLDLSEVTIKHHLKGLRSKLGARNRTHAVCRAIELGIG
ncbi:response regulator transcription factor [Alphaproteobacteria bacterium]|nr:response regulator transcription factor [Alphaproteobacteria bacterium]